MKKRKSLLPLIVIVPLVILFFTFKLSEFTKSTPPEQVVINFYHWYTDFAGNALLSGEYSRSEYVSEELVVNIENRLNESKGAIGKDPFTCNINEPDEFIATTISSENETAEVALDQFFGEEVETINIILIKDNGKWLIDEIEC